MCSSWRGELTIRSWELNSLRSQTADKQLTNKINLSNLRVIEMNKYEVP